MFVSLFVNLINWVNIVARFYENSAGGISIQNISFLSEDIFIFLPVFLSYKIFTFAYQIRRDVTGCCKNLEKEEKHIDFIEGWFSVSYTSPERFDLIGKNYFFSFSVLSAGISRNQTLAAFLI